MNDDTTNNNTDDSKEKESNQSKIQLLKSILSEVNIFATTVKNLESSLYQKEQETEAAAAEAYLEKDSEDEKQAVPVDGEDKPKMESEGEEEESTFFSIIKNALGFIVVLLPLLFKGFDDIKKLFGELPDIMGGSFKDIVFGLFDKIQSAIDQYVFQPISDYLSNTVSEIWKSLISGIEDTFSGIIGGLPEFLKTDLPKLVKEVIPGAVGDFGKEKEPGTQPDIDMEGAFGTTEKPSFGGEYKPPEFGSKPPPPSPAQPAPSAQPTQAAPESAPTTGTPVASAPAGAVRKEPPAAPTQQAQRQDTGRVEEKEKKDGVKAKTPENYTGKAKVLVSILRQMGLTNDKAIAAIVATASKESGLDPAAKELGAKPWYNTAKKRGIDYIYKIFPQLKAGGRVAKKFGYNNGVPLDVFMQWAAAGDEVFFNAMYPGENPYKYIGRGLIQITGKTNYEKAGKRIGVDLAENPELLGQDFNIASSALLAYLADSIGRGNYDKGIDVLNAVDDFDMALKLVVANVASGGFGSDMKKIEEAFSGDGKLAENKRVQLEKASKFSEEALAIASAPSAESPEITPIPPEVQVASNVQEATKQAKQAKESEEEKQQQQVIVQTAMASQPKPQIGEKTQEAGPGTKPRAEPVQRSYSSYFAVA